MKRKRYALAPIERTGLGRRQEGDLFLLCSLEDTRESCSQGLRYIEAAVIEDYVAGICLVDGVVYGYVLLKLAEVSGEPIKSSS